MDAAAASRSLRSRLAGLLEVRDEFKPRVYADIFESSGVVSLNYWLELVISAGIATFGLVQNSPAVIIGAMLISPLMGPLMGSGLSLAAGDLYLGIKSLANLVVSVAAAVALSAAIVWYLPFHSTTGEILARTNPNLLDLGIALLSGLAGSLVVCRGGGGGGVMALPGVAIAVALMPPLCTVGFGVGSGFNWEIIGGAGLLFLTNLVAIITSAFAVFFVVRMDSPATRGEISRYVQSRAAGSSLYRLLRRTALSGSVGHIGKVSWRMGMLGLVLAGVSVPLANGLQKVKQEVAARTAVQQPLKSLLPASALVAQEVRLGGNLIAIRVISTEHVEPVRISETSTALERRTGRKVNLTVQEVASKSELVELLDRMTPPPPVPVVERPLEQAGAVLLERAGAALGELWPSEIPLMGMELGFTAAGPVLPFSTTPPFLRCRAWKRFCASGCEIAWTPPP